MKDPSLGKNSYFGGSYSPDNIYSEDEIKHFSQINMQQEFDNTRAQYNINGYDCFNGNHIYNGMMINAPDYDFTVDYLKYVKGYGYVNKYGQLEIPDKSNGLHPVPDQIKVNRVPKFMNSQVDYDEILRIQAMEDKLNMARIAMVYHSETGQSFNDLTEFQKQNYMKYGTIKPDEAQKVKDAVKPSRRSFVYGTDDEKRAYDDVVGDLDKYRGMVQQAQAILDSGENPYKNFYYTPYNFNQEKLLSGLREVVDKSIPKNATFEQVNSKYLGELVYNVDNYLDAVEKRDISKRYNPATYTDLLNYHRTANRSMVRAIAAKNNFNMDTTIEVDGVPVQLPDWLKCRPEDIQPPQITPSIGSGVTQEELDEYNIVPKDKSVSEKEIERRRRFAESIINQQKQCRF